MLNKAFTGFHKLLKTNIGLQNALAEVEYEDIGKLAKNTVFYRNVFLYRFVHANINLMLFKRDLDFAITNLIETVEPQQSITLPMLEISGLAAGKTNLYDDFSNLDDFSQKLVLAREYPKPNPILFETEIDFQKNIQYIQENLFRITLSDRFRIIYLDWENRFFIENNDGAHHLAAIYRQCREQSKHFAITGNLEKHRVNQQCLQTILENCYIFILMKNVSRHIASILYDFTIKSDAISFDTGFILEDAFTWYSEHRVFFIQKTSPKASIAYNFIKSHIPANKAFDVTAYLRTLVN